jgi:hypothetical protein
VGGTGVDRATYTTMAHFAEARELAIARGLLSRVPWPGGCSGYRYCRRRWPNGPWARWGLVGASGEQALTAGNSSSGLYFTSTQ